MAERRPRKASPKRSRLSGDEIARTPEYKKLLADLVAIIKLAKGQGAIFTRVAKRNPRKPAKRKRAGDGK